MDFGVTALAPLLVACVDLLLGVVIFLQDPRNSTNIAYALFAFTVSLWGFGVGLFFIEPASSPWLNFLSRFVYFAGGSIPVAFLFFAEIFNSRKNTSRMILIGIFIPIPIFLYLYFFTNTIIVGPTVLYDGSRGYQFGILHYLFDIQLWVYFLWAFVILAKQYYASEKATANQVALIVFGTYSVLAIAGVTNVVAPLLSIFYLSWIGPTSTIIWTWVVAYAVIRHQLFNIRIVAAELLIISLWLALIIRIFFSESIEELWINIIFLVIVIVLGILFIRSIIKETRQREQIERLSEEKSEFMSFASHEIRNPITAMRGYASLIADGTTGEVSPTVKDAAQKIFVNGDTVLSLISDFLNKSKLELGQITYEMSDVDAGKVATSIAEGFQSHAQQKGLALEVKIDFPELIARADEAKLREVVGNLVDNAVKYTPAGRVTIEIEKRNGMARIIVADTGVGIQKEILPHLFQKFSRADAQKMNLLGTGLGLYLAKTFIKGMGGRVWAESDGKDRGSRFVIELHAV